jgi:hypothetical protein
MKVNFIQTIIAVAISILIAYGFYSFHNGESKLILSVGSLLFLSATLIMAIGISFKQSRTTTNIRVVSGIFFFVGVVSNLIFSFFHFVVPSYIIVNGILLLTFGLIAYSIFRAKQ